MRRSRSRRRAAGPAGQAALRDPRCRTDPWDPIKYLVSTTLTSNLVWGRDPRPLDRDDLDLLEAFVALSFDSFTLRGGRQEIQYASSRLVSIREGPNVRLAFDGLRIIQRVGERQMDGLAVVPVEVRRGVFDDRAERGQSFGGVYATGPRPRTRATRSSPFQRVPALEFKRMRRADTPIRSSGRAATRRAAGSRSVWRLQPSDFAIVAAVYSKATAASSGRGGIEASHSK